MALRSSVLALVLVAAACGGSSAPTWVRVTLGASDQGPAPEALDLGSVGGAPVRFVRDERGAWLETTLARAAWKERESGAWMARLHVRGRGTPRSGPAEELFSAQRRFTLTDRAMVAAGAFPLEHFLLTSEGGGGNRLPVTWVVLRLAPGEEPPELTTARVFAETRDAADPTRVTGERLSGEGLSVVPGHPVRRTLDVPSGSMLRFTTSFEPALVSGGRADVGRTLFRVRADGETVFEHEVAKVQQPEIARHAVALPAGSAAELSFEVEGPFAYTSFVAPVVGPAEIGRYGERPWGRTRPDVIVFLADTFRADNMRAYGSELPLTPFLDELAGRSLLCREAWSVATYTMPAHAAMFSGMYARQTGATTTLNALPDEVQTIAERFAERGYRTGAITDAVVVSHQNNLDQGFESFDELHGELEDTLDRVRRFLDADDGRPLFLYVQSYRTHSPYVASPAARERLGGVLDIPQSFGVLSTELTDLARELSLEGDLTNLRKTTKEFYEKLYVERGASAEQVQRYEHTVARLEALYRAGASDLDEGVRELYGELEARGLFADGLLVFTSDHGEAFNEHDKVFHGGKVWGETTRVPLFLHGPFVSPGVLEHPVSLIDLAPTLAGVAGLSTEGFLGTSILRLERDRPIFSFENQEGEASTFAIVERSRKVMGFEDPARRRELFAAFDLSSDPRETRDLAAEPPAWAGELLQRLGPAVEELSTPRFGSLVAPVDPARLEALRALGYGGEDGG